MILFAWLVMSWAGNCQPFSFRHAEDEWLESETPDSCIQLIRGPIVSDERLI